MMDERKAVIDLGSNSVRLVIYEQGPHGTLLELDNLKQTVRLSSHLDDSHRITNRGIELTLAVLLQFQRLCYAMRVTETIGVATQAVRMAVNQEEVLDRIEQTTGIRFRVLPGMDEARYGYLAVVNSLPLTEGVTVDVGGGSTEITYFRNRQLVDQVSIPYGAVSLTREFIHSDPLPLKDLKVVKDIIREQLDKYPWLEGLGCTAVGLGGTARSIAKMHQREHQYPLELLHGYGMKSSDVAEILEKVRSQTVEHRTEISGLSSDRTDIIVAGTAILNEVLDKVKASDFFISNKGLRDGILMEQVLQTIGQEFLPDILLHSVENIHHHFGLNQGHLYHVWKLAEVLRLGLVRHGRLADSEEMRRCLKVAALLHDWGRSINIYNTRHHTFYLIVQAPLFGLSHREQVIVAGIAAFKAPKQIAGLLAGYIGLLEAEDLTTIARLGTILGLTRVLDRTRTRAVSSITVNCTKAECVIGLDAEHPLDLELSLASEWIKKWRKVFEWPMRLEVTQHDISKELQ